MTPEDQIDLLLQNEVLLSEKKMLMSILTDKEAEKKQIREELRALQSENESLTQENTQLKKQLVFSKNTRDYWKRQYTGTDENNYDYFSINVGDIIQFGKYEQSSDESFGKERIEWIVLDKEPDKALLVSRYVLDNKPYNEEYEGVTWESCTLRKWLNTVFFNKAFSLSENRRILPTNVKANENPFYSTPPGSDTRDKVFILSIAEAQSYCRINEFRFCFPTDYADKKPANIYSDNLKDDVKETCYWWLRTPGENSESAVLISDCAAIDDDDYDEVDYDHGIRPALWISI